VKDAYPLYLRPAAILVRPDNPKNIRGLRDLLAPRARTEPRPTKRGRRLSI